MALPYFTALVGSTLAVLALTVGPTPAHAKPYRVRIDSLPSGATVYLDSKDREPLGQTPFRGKLPAGSHTLIVELDGYVSQVQDITIRKHRRVQRVEVKLSKINLATLEVVADKSGADGRGMDLRGARVLVDGRDVGTLPDTIQVPAGPHQVEVIMEGYKTFETWIEAAEGERVTVTAQLIPAGPRRAPTRGTAAAESDAADESPAAPNPRPGAAMAGVGEDDDPPDQLVDAGDKPAAAPHRDVPFVTLGAGLEMGGRNYQPSTEEVGGLRNYTAVGVLLVRLTAEVSPLAFSPNKLLSGWGLYGTYARATPLTSNVTIMEAGAEQKFDVPTEWSELDVGARYRYLFAPGTFVGALAGFGTHTFGFDLDGQTESIAQEVPDVAYRFIRIGAEGRYDFGRFAALASGGTRFVNSIGKLGDRFAKTDITSLSAGIGVAASVTSSIEARLVGHYDRYTHDYTAAAGSPDPGPDTGTDQFYGAMLSAQYSY